MVPAARRDQEDTSLALNHRFGPQKPTMVLRFFGIMSGVIFFHLPNGVIKRASGVEGGHPVGSQVEHLPEEGRLGPQERVS